MLICVGRKWRQERRRALLIFDLLIFVKNRGWGNRQEYSFKRYCILALAKRCWLSGVIKLLSRILDFL